MKFTLTEDITRTITIDLEKLVRSFPDEAWEYRIEIDDDTDQLIPFDDDRGDQFILDAFNNGVFENDDYRDDWDETDNVHIVTASN